MNPYDDDLRAAIEAVESARLARDGTPEAERRYQTSKQQLAKIRRVWRTQRDRDQAGSPNGAVAKPQTLRAQARRR